MLSKTTRYLPGKRVLGRLHCPLTGDVLKQVPIGFVFLCPRFSPTNRKLTPNSSFLEVILFLPSGERNLITTRKDQHPCLSETVKLYKTQNQEEGEKRKPFRLLVGPFS